VMLVVANHWNVASCFSQEETTRNCQTTNLLASQMSWTTTKDGVYRLLVITVGDASFGVLLTEQQAAVIDDQCVGAISIDIGIGILDVHDCGKQRVCLQRLGARRLRRLFLIQLRF
jgi:hypothetical protein